MEGWTSNSHMKKDRVASRRWFARACECPNRFPKSQASELSYPAPAKRLFHQTQLALRLLNPTTKTCVISRNSPDKTPTKSRPPKRPDSPLVTSNLSTREQSLRPASRRSVRTGRVISNTKYCLGRWDKAKAVVTVSHLHPCRSRSRLAQRAPPTWAYTLALMPYASFFLHGCSTTY